MVIITCQTYIKKFAIYSVTKLCLTSITKSLTEFIDVPAKLSNQSHDIFHLALKFLFHFTSCILNKIEF